MQNIAWLPIRDSQSVCNQMVSVEGLESLRVFELSSRYILKNIEMDSGTLTVFVNSLVKLFSSPCTCLVCALRFPSGLCSPSVRWRGL